MFCETASPKCPEGFDLVICTPPLLADSPSRNASPEVQKSLRDPTTKLSIFPWLNFAFELRRSMSHLHVLENLWFAPVSGQAFVAILNKTCRGHWDSNEGIKTD